MGQQPVRFLPTVRLGAGGMAQVHLARMIGAGGEQWVALKRIRTELRDDPALKQRWQREAEIGARLNHPNIVRLLEFGADDDGPWLAFDYVFGRPLSSLVKASTSAGRHLPVIAALSIGHDVASALAYAHASSLPELSVISVVHRDVTLDNIMVSYEGRALLADFGVARLMGEVTQITQTRAVVGKPGYLAPELFDGHDADVQTDIFAFGVSLYWMLCGVAPFRGNTDAALMRAVFSQRPPPPRTLRPEIPEAVDRVVMSCLHTDRTRRAANMEAVRNALADALGGDEADARTQVIEALGALLPSDSDPRTGVSAVPPAARPQTLLSQPPGVRRRRRMLIGIASGGALLAAASLVAIVAGDDGSDEAPPVLEVLGQDTPPTRGPDQGTRASEAPEASAAAIDEHPAKEPQPVPGAAPVAKQAPARTAPAPDRVPPRTSRRSARAKEQGHRTGTLSVRVRPWAQVFVDGELVGVTPFAPVQLQPGNHSVIVVNPKLGARRAFTVNVKAGRTEELTVTLP